MTEGIKASHKVSSPKVSIRVDVGAEAGNDDSQSEVVFVIVRLLSELNAVADWLPQTPNSVARSNRVETLADLSIYVV